MLGLTSLIFDLALERNVPHDMNSISKFEANLKLGLVFGAKITKNCEILMVSTNYNGLHDKGKNQSFKELQV